MIDISDKKAVKRQASAFGKIMLNPKTIQAIKKFKVKKGDVLQTAKIAGINSAKQTQILIPYCHQIPLDLVDLEFEIRDNSIDVTCIVKTIAKTGVEMEALVGVTIALNTIWDMIKYLEKDEKGQYPNTRIESVKITRKWKE